VTTVAAPDPMAFDKLLSSSWALFKRNWIVALPPIIAVAVFLAAVGVLAVIVIAALAGSKSLTQAPGGAVAAILFGYLALIGLGFVAFWWAYVAMFGMADAAWSRGTTSLADGFAAFRRSAWRSLAAFIGMVGLVILALILAIPTLCLSLLALPIVTMYVLPAVVSGGRGGFEAIAESFRLVRRFFVPSLITVLVLLGIQYAIGMIGGFGLIPLQVAAMPSGSNTTALVMPPIPLIFASGLIYLISLVAGLAYSGFYAIAVVGMYRNLASQPAAAPPAGAAVTPA
jgi:hypothetical protein